MARKHGDEKPEAGKGKKAKPLTTSGEALMELVKHKKFDELKQRLLATETLDVKSDTVLEAFFRSMQPEDLESCACTTPRTPSRRTCGDPSTMRFRHD